MSSVVDGTDGDMLWNGNEEDGDVRSECEGDEGTDSEDGDSDTDWYRQIESDTSEINPTRCNNCVYSSQWLYSTCFG